MLEQVGLAVYLHQMDKECGQEKRTEINLKLFNV